MAVVPRLVGDRFSSVTGEWTYPINFPSSLGFRVPDPKNSSTCKVSQNLLARLAK